MYTELSTQAAQYIQALKAPDYESLRKKFEDPSPDTLGWFLQGKDLCAWLETDESSILRIEGSAGQGKTTLAKFILTNLEKLTVDRNITCPVIYFLFYDQDDNYRTVGAVLRSLVKQLLLIRDTFQIISQTSDIESSVITEDSLWRVLEHLLRAPIFHTVYCVLDALDECQDSPDRRRLWRLIKGLVQQPIMTREKTPFLKFLMVSRPMVELTRELDQSPLIQLKANPHDLQIFIHREAHALKLDRELLDTAVNLLLARAEQTFLWISIVIKKLRRTTTLLSQASLAKIIEETPSDLSKLYDDLVTRIIEDEDVAAQKLLTWVAFSRRALTLGELEEALAIQEDSYSKADTMRHKIRLTQYTVTSAIGVLLEVTADNKVYLIHQSAKQFLHKSGHLASAGFTGGLLPSTYLAKLCMIYLCFHEFKTESGRNSESLKEWNRRHPFLPYAARNWHHHIVDDEDAKKLTQFICQLTAPHSPTLLAWGQAAGIRDLEKAENAWDVAMRAGIPWLAEFQLGGDVISVDTVITAAGDGLAGWNSLRRLVKNSAVLFSEGAIRAIVRHFDREMIRLLLHHHGATVNAVTLLTEAIMNRAYGRFVVDLLLETKPRFDVTATLVRLVAQNDVSGQDIIELLLRYEGANFQEDAVVAVAQRFDQEVVRVMLSSRDNFKVTEDIFEAAVKNRGSGDEIITLLLEQDQAFPVTETMVWAVLTINSQRMAALLERRCEDLEITDTMIRNIAKSCNNEVLGLLLNGRGGEVTVTEDVLKTAARYNYEVLNLLLNHCGSDAVITEAILVATVINVQDCEEALTELLSYQGSKITITEGVFVAAARKRWKESIMELLLNYQGSTTTITESVLIAAALNQRGGVEVMRLLLDHRQNEVIITEVVIVAALKGDSEVMRLLLGRRKNEVRITDGILVAMANGDRCFEEELLNHRHGNKVEITEEILIAAAKEYWRRKQVIQLLLASRQNEIRLTETVLVQAAHCQGGDEVLKLLLDHQDIQITITAEVIGAAAENEDCGNEILKLLLDHPKNEGILTEKVVIAAAGNKTWGKDILKLLLSCWQNKIVVTEAVLIAATANRHCGNEVLQLLLNHRQNEVILTEKVIIAALGNERLCEEILKLLLDCCQNGIVVTEAVLMAAVQNYHSGVHLRNLLLGRGDEIQIIEQVLDTALFNDQANDNLKLLLRNIRRTGSAMSKETLRRFEGRVGRA